MRSRTSSPAAPYAAQSVCTSGESAASAASRSVIDRQRLELDDDCVDGLLGDRRGGRRDRGDHLALESHDVAGEQRAVLHERPEANIGNVVGGQHGHHAGHGSRRRDVELGDAGVGDVGVAELGGEHAR